MPEYDETSSRRSRYWVGGIVIVALLLAVTAAGMWLVRGVGVGSSATETTESSSYDDISELAMRTESGGIDITTGEGDQVKVESVMHWRGGSKPESSERASDDTLRIEQRGCGGIALECWVEYRIEVPAETAVDIKQDAGNVSTSGVSGPQRIDVSAGDVTLVEPAGDIAVDNSAGNVTGQRLESEKVEIEQSAGDLTLDFVDVPTSVASTTSAGNIDVAVPGTESYAVDANSDAGEVTVTAPEKASSGYEITAHSSAGDVTVRDGQD